MNMSGNARVFSVITILALVALGASAAAKMMIMPGRSHKGPLPPLSPEESGLGEGMRRHVVELAGTIGERNLLHYDRLVEAAEYVKGRLTAMDLPVREDRYRIQGKDVANIEAELTGATRPNEIVLVGAHYDSVTGSPGANDNASGVAALLELARLLKAQKPARTIRFVAFVNEEPPYFQTEEMGSLVYARRARQRGDNIVTMLSIETVGYYSDRHNSQQYPAPLSRFYPDTANFIAFVANTGSGSLLRRAIATFRKTTQFPSEGVAAPASIIGIGWSDHWSFWQAGYRALMVTDTAVFRYPYYHEGADTPDCLDFGRMARVVGGIKHVVQDLANN